MMPQCNKKPKQNGCGKGMSGPDRMDHTFSKQNTWKSIKSWCVAQSRSKKLSLLRRKKGGK